MTRIASLLAIAALTAAPAFARPAEGTNLALKSVPPFLTRVFVPVVAGTNNTFTVESLPIQQIVETPAPYRLALAKGALQIQAPAGEASGYARVRSGNRELTLTLVNLVPHSSVRNGWLDGYRIGEYLTKPLRGLSTYERPKGFIRLTKANGELWVSDRYRLKDFQCKLDGVSKFLVVRTEALFKLELLQEELQKQYGVKFDRFTIMSGYRTPFYNAMIGNETGYSRHLYGDAMDIYIDTDKSGAMDDINRDGRVDAKDAKFLLSVAEAIDKSSLWSWLKGGAGVYKANSAHGPYVHVDTRGYIARWGV